MANTLGTIDYRDERFVARFPYDAALVAQIKTLKLGERQRSSDEWTIERHRPSVARLVRIARDRSWVFTAEARRQIEQLQEEADAAEFSIDVVQGSAGEPWFRCLLGDDSVLQQRVGAIADAYEDDGSWWVPAFREESCTPLLEIAEEDDRLEISNAAWRLLREPDESFELPRGATADDSQPDSSREEDEATLLSGTWEATELDYETHSLSYATREDDFKVAPSLRGTLLPFQVAGVRYLCSSPRAFLADELGLGKTIQALATIETLAAYPALIICPASLSLNWLREAQRWLPEGKTISALHGPFESVPLVDVLVVSYELLPKHHPLLRDRGFEAIVADESHYLRSGDSARTQAAIEVAATVPSLRLCLSATPCAAGRPIELAAQLAFLGLLEQEFGGFWSFASRYCAPKDDGAGMRFGSARADELAQRLRSTCYCKRQKSAVLAQLPANPRAVQWIDLERREAYAAIEEEARIALRALGIEEEQDPSSSAGYAERADARRLQRLEYVQRVMHESGRQKTANIARWVANFLSSGEPLVVFAQHPDVMHALRESFPRALAITANDTPTDVSRAVRAFQSGEAQLILCSLHAAGVGVTLTRAAHAAFAEIGWSAGSHDRAEGRIHRIGQERAATAWYLVGDGTIDELLLDVIERKRVMAGQLHESVLLEVASEIARLTEPRPALAESHAGTRLRSLHKIVG